MKLLPYRKYTIETEFSYDETRSKLAENLAPWNSYFFKGGFTFNFIRKFEGVISGDTFRIRRMLKGTNSFKPLINGKFVSTEKGCRIQLSLRFYGFIIVLMIIWFIGTLIGSLAFLLPGIKQGIFDPLSLIGVMMMLFGYALMMITFWVESDQAKRELLKIFKGKIV